MTNGEIIQRDFPNEFLSLITLFTREWWNTEYKEPTTKNDLAVDCNNCKNNFHRGDGTSYCATGDGMCHYECEEPITKNDLADDKTFYKQMVEYCNEHLLVLVEKDVWEDARKALTTKNDLGVDAISRQAINGYIDYILSHGMGKKKSFDFIKKFVANLPPVTPQEPHSFKWCETCKEYDQEKHCCHRYSKVIRDTVAEIRQEPVYTSQIAQKVYEDGKKDGYVQAKLEQEPILDKIRAEIMDTGAYEQEVNGKTEFLKGINCCLSVIDKHISGK